MDHADTMLHGFHGRLNVDLFPVDQHFSLKSAGLVNGGHAKENIHNRGFTGAILADQCHNVTRLYPEAHILENFVAKELFFNVIHFQYVLTAQNFSPSSKLGRLAAFKPIL